MAKILVQFTEVTKLSQILGVSRVTVTSALNDRTKSKLAQKIRAAAIERGGKEMDKNTTL